MVHILAASWFCCGVLIIARWDVCRNQLRLISSAAGVHCVASLFSAVCFSQNKAGWHVRVLISRHLGAMPLLLSFSALAALCSACWIIASDPLRAFWKASAGLLSARLFSVTASMCGRACELCHGWWGTWDLCRVVPRGCAPAACACT
ncbi:hypothetical protein DL89DRAFT_57777 [Linderina pennispora]|uniref:Uncharacterized protein n=1 Tax=Linderina pennispora TaxID=61395 RepID=A0A1Y1VRS5_9FUNG|nr:uncharacterized protein DL89DRAFT_57777 [Linderina pennispora]ORX63967.1 hypothetical protein DL89DRAFT_57777 [Linderina pennispora]